MAVQRPLVVMLGWLGCKTRHLQKIARLYDGFDVDREFFIEGPLSLIRLREQKTEMEAIYRKSLNRPLLVHAFSLTGASALIKTFTDANVKPRPGLDVRGLVLDSTPCRVTHEIHRKAFPKALFPNSRALERATQLLLTPLFDAFVDATGVIKWGARITAEIYRSPWANPTLMLGSVQDRLIPNSELVAYAELARKAGASVETRFWPDSGHVRVSMDHAAEYAEIVRAFARAHLLAKK
jgi:pimeloyl-ACP methyl ester carboxylesterase